MNFVKLLKRPFLKNTFINSFSFSRWRFDLLALSLFPCGMFPITLSKEAMRVNHDARRFHGVNHIVQDFQMIHEYNYEGTQM